MQRQQIANIPTDLSQYLYLSNSPLPTTKSHLTFFKVTFKDIFKVVSEIVHFPRTEFHIWGATTEKAWHHYYFVQSRVAHTKQGPILLFPQLMQKCHNVCHCILQGWGHLWKSFVPEGKNGGMEVYVAWRFLLRPALAK